MLDPELPPSPADLTQIHARLLAAVTYRLRDPVAAEDATQESMLLLWTRWPDLVRRAQGLARDGDAASITNLLVGYLATCAYRTHVAGQTRRHLQIVDDAQINEVCVDPNQGADADLAAIAPEFEAKLAEFRASLSAREQAVLDAALANTPRDDLARALGTTANAVWQIKKRLKPKLARAEHLLAICASMRIAREGNYGSGEDGLDLVEASLVTPVGTAAACRLDTPGLRWHRDGHVRGALLAQQDGPALPPVVVGIGWLSGKPHERRRAVTAPFVLTFRGGRADLDALVGAPPHSDGSGDGIVVPGAHLSLALAN